MVAYVIGTNSIHMSAEVYDYLPRRIDVGSVVHVVNSHPGSDDTNNEGVRDGEDALNAVVSRLSDLMDVGTHQYIRGNNATDDVLQCADEHDADEIVIGIRKRNPISRIVPGSTAQDVLLHSNTPMAVVPLETV